MSSGTFQQCPCSNPYHKKFPPIKPLKWEKRLLISPPFSLRQANIFNVWKQFIKCCYPHSLLNTLRAFPWGGWELKHTWPFLSLSILIAREINKSTFLHSRILFAIYLINGSNFKSCYIFSSLWISKTPTMIWIFTVPVLSTFYFCLFFVERSTLTTLL